MRSPPKSNSLFWGFAGSVLLIAVYMAIASLISRDIDYRIALYSIIALFGLTIIIGGEEGLTFAFLGWIGSFALGYRTFKLTPNLKIHPSEIILLVLCALIFTIRLPRTSRPKQVLIPGWLFLLAPFWIWGWFLGAQHGYPKDAMLSEARNFMMLFPIFITGSVILCNRDRWKIGAAVFYGAGTWIAIWGVAEYYFPALRTIFPGFVTIAGAQGVTGEGFARAGFSFWGTAAATYTCALAIPFAIPLWRWFPKLWQRVLLFLAMFLMVQAVYIGGFRILWAALAIQFALFAAIKKRYVLAGVALLAVLGAYTGIPDSTRERFGTFFEVLHGTPAANDSSGLKHLNELTGGINQALNEPMGIGWTGAGWVHCDFVQMAANLSIPAGLIYAGAFLLTLMRLTVRVTGRGLSEEYRDLAIAVLLSFMTAGALMSTQAVSVLPQLAHPVWFSWLLAEIVSRKSSFEGRLRASRRPYLITANVKEPFPV